MLDATLLDRRSIHQRLIETGTFDASGDDEEYVTLESDVPIRIEQPEVEARVRPTGDVIDYTAWVLPTIENAPQERDRFRLSDRDLYVLKVEDLTDLDGELHHYALDCKVIHRG